MKNSLKNSIVLSLYLGYMLLTSVHLDAYSAVVSYNHISENSSSGYCYYIIDDTDELLLKEYCPSKKVTVSNISVLQFYEFLCHKNHYYYSDYIERISQSNFNYPISAYKISFSMYTADF